MPPNAHGRLRRGPPPSRGLDELLAEPNARPVCALRVNFCRLGPPQQMSSASCTGQLARIRARRSSAGRVKSDPARRTAGVGRVEVWRGGVRLSMSVSAPFVWRCLSGSAVAPFPHPAHRTGRADFPHPALGQDLTPSSTARRAQAGSDVRARSARRGARVDSSRPFVA